MSGENSLDAVVAFTMPGFSGSTGSGIMSTGKVCEFCHGVHKTDVCETANTGVVALIDRGAAMAGSQAALSKVIGLSIAGLSRARTRGTLDSDYRAALVQYLRNPKLPPKPVERGPGRRPLGAATHEEVLPWIQGTQTLLEQFSELGDEHEHGRAGALTNALSEFMTNHAKKLPPPPGPLPRPHMRCRVDGDVFVRFERFVGGPRLRTRYTNLAVDEWVERQMKKRSR